MKQLRLVVTGYVLLVTLACSHIATHMRETPLVPGPFGGLDRARLGAGIVFQNDIDSHTCFPLEVDGRTTTWLTRAYITVDRIIVRRCEVIEDGALVVRHGYWGWAPPVWDQVVAAPQGSLQFLPLDLPRWTFLANPVFCDTLVAYWGIEDDDGERSILQPTVFDLAAGAIVQASTVGSIEIRTDWEGFLEPPVWNATCQIAEFDGQPVERPTTTLTVSR